MVETIILLANWFCCIDFYIFSDKIENGKNTKSKKKEKVFFCFPKKVEIRLKNLIQGQFLAAASLKRIQEEDLKLQLFSFFSFLLFFLPLIGCYIWPTDKVHSPLSLSYRYLSFYLSVFLYLLLSLFLSRLCVERLVKSL